MLYLHDVWVNWFEGEENGYNVCQFHEWRKKDSIELLDQAPLLYITESLFDYLENGMQDLPDAMLKTIWRRAYMRKGQERSVLDYACVATNGFDIIVIDTIGYHIPVRKSRLIPRQEQLVFDMIKDVKPKHFNHDGNPPQKSYDLLSIPPHYMFGLTRRERQLKQLLMMGLDQLRTTNNIEELRYWLTEWNPKKYPYLRHMTENEVWQALYDGVKKGWTSRHEDLCAKLVKGHPFLERMWELEADHETTSNQ